jgi:hypothetical protein
MTIQKQGHALDVAILAAGCCLLAAGAGEAAPSAAPGYSLEVFAGPLAGSSAPDSITKAGRNIFVGYGNGGAPDGSGGAMSTIAEYGPTGALVGTLTLIGHNDGLRYDAATHRLWAIQNEDANPNLVLIDPKTLTASSPLAFSATPHGGGYDDVAFGAGGAFMSASNPANNPNTSPAIVSVGLSPSQVVVNGAILAANATASVLNPGGGITTLNLQDPDSMIMTASGQLVLDSQSDHQLVFVKNPGGASQSVGVLNLANEVDDTAFARAGRQTLFFTDQGSGVIYALTGSFRAGQAVSAADTLGQIVGVNRKTGAFTPLVTGLMAPKGELFAAVPEPGTWAMVLTGFWALGGTMRRRRSQALV